MVEFRVKHSNNLAALVVDDRLVLLVPKRRYGEAADIVRVRFAVQITELGESVQRVFGICTISAVKYPAVLCKLEPADNKLDERFEAFQRAYEIRAVRPGTAPVNVEDIAVFFGRELGGGIFGDEIAELTVLSTELAIFVGMFVDFCLVVVQFGTRGTRME
jgi:hypothetical protein